MNLQDVFNSMALQLLTEPGELMRYANEDQLGGYHWDKRLEKWPMGSLFAEEGQVLYALIRKYKPQRIVEIGTLRGCSTAHMAMALSVNGEGGQIHAVDVNANAGDLFPDNLKSYVTSVTDKGELWLAAQENESIDFLFEDSSHGTEMCYQIAELCKTKLKAGGLFVTHDAAHDYAVDGNGNKANSPVGAEIRRGLTRALGNEYRVYLADDGGSDCGFALWRKPLPAVTPLVDIHSQPTNLLNDIREVHERLTEQAKTVGLNPVAPEVEFKNTPEYGIHQRIDNEFKSQEHLPTEELPFGEFDMTDEAKPVEPPKKKRGRPSKKDKAADEKPPEYDSNNSASGPRDWGTGWQPGMDE